LSEECIVAAIAAAGSPVVSLLAALWILTRWRR